MNLQRNICLITAVINKNVSSSVHLLDHLQKNGIVSLSLVIGRSSVVEEKQGLSAVLSPGTSLSSDSVDILSFVVPPDQEEKALSLVIEKCRLQRMGHGSVFSEERSVVETGQPYALKNTSVSYADTPLNTISGLIGICCIVQRGQADGIAKVALETGSCMPFITFGRGTGVRDKLGILRITISAEKELIRVVTSASDADMVMDMMIEAGRLDLPAKGFIYQYPVRRGLIDTKVSRGTVRHAASMEQIITAIDEIKGGIEWRSRQTADDGGRGKKRNYLSNLVELVMICNDGRSEDLVKAAMQVGAAGATTGQIKRITLSAAEGKKIPPAREISSMIVPEKALAPIADALEATGLHDDRTAGQLQVRPVPKAFTYLPKKS